MNYRYGNYTNPYMQPYGLPNYTQPQYQMQSQPMAQPQMAQQQAQQPMQYETPIQYVGYANLKEAEAHILFPNQKAIFIDKANGMVYEKVCANDGQSFITHFKRVDLESEKTPLKSTEKEKSIDYSTFATKQDLGQFVSLEQYKELAKQIEQLKKQLGGRQNGNRQERNQ